MELIKQDATEKERNGIPGIFGRVPNNSGTFQADTVQKAASSDRNSPSACWRFFLEKEIYKIFTPQDENLRLG